MPLNLVQALKILKSCFVGEVTVDPSFVECIDEEVVRGTGECVMEGPMDQLSHFIANLQAVEGAITEMMPD